MNLGIAGEVRLVVERPDGTIKADTGFNKNMILNQGLDFIGGQGGTAMGAYCVIGAGNSAPLATQTQLDSYVSTQQRGGSSDNRTYIDDGSGIFKVSQTNVYEFVGLNNVNVSELGLVSYTTPATSYYYLCTRALVKNNAGEAMTLTILQGEVLRVYYKLWMVFSTSDTIRTINVSDGKGNDVPYNTICRLGWVNNSGASNSYTAGNKIQADNGGVYRDAVGVYSGEISDNILSGPTLGLLFNGNTSRVVLTPYVVGSYKRVLNYIFQAGEANGSIRALSINTYLGFWQIRYGTVSGDNPIIKTDKERLTLPIEFSWGRYEGEL